MVSLTDLPEDLWNNIILPVLSINDLYALILTSKAAGTIINKYKGIGRYEYANIVTSVDKTRTLAEALVKKFSQIRLKLILLSRLSFDRTDISSISDNIVTLTCQYNSIYLPANIMPKLQHLNLRGAAPTLNRMLEDCSHLFPALTHLRMKKLINVDKIEIRNNMTLCEISINFDEITCPITIDNIPNLTLLELSTGDGEEYDSEYPSDDNMVNITNVPNLTTLAITNYRINFDLMQFTSLKNLTLYQVNYKLPSGIGLYQIKFNEVFPELQSLGLSNVVTYDIIQEESTLGNISNLRELYLIHLWELKHIGDLSNIEFINISECYNLEAINSITNVKDLTINDCPELNENFYRADIGHVKMAL